MIKKFLKKSLAFFGYKLCRISDKSIESAKVPAGNNELPRELLEPHKDVFFGSYAQRMRTNAQRGGRHGFHELLEAAPLSSEQFILDIGLGNGDASRFFVSKGLNVTATAFSSQNFQNPERELKEVGVKVVNALVDALPFEDESFDAIWCSHVIEHTLNPGLALREIRRVLKHDAWLFIMVPPYKSKIAGGHLMTGWNIGQLIYVLLLCGFNVKDGHFARLGYNVTGFVRKSGQPLPPLYSDIGDLEALTNYWPTPFFQGFEGRLDFVNWPPCSQQSRTLRR